MKLIRHLIPILLFISCTSPIAEPDIPDKGGEVQLSLSLRQSETKSLNGTAAETWEKKINTASIYIFQASTGKLIYAYPLNSTQINAINTGSSNNVTFIVPVIGSQNYNIYLVANTTPSAAVSTESSLLASIEQDIASYNGVYTDVTTKALRSQGFVMTGSAGGITLSNGSTASVNLTLRRIVAKIGIEINISALITLGTTVVTNVALSQSAPTSNLFPLTTANTTGTAITLNQIPQQNASNSRQFRAFFYIYENDIRTISSNQVKITFQVVNTVLGIGTTYTYNASVTGDGTGKISRNRGYYIIANVNKLINILLVRSTSQDVLILTEKAEPIR